MTTPTSRHAEFLRISTELAQSKLNQALAQARITLAERELRSATITTEALTRRLHKLEARL